MADIKQFVFFDFEMLCSDTGMAFEAMEAIRLGAVKYELETEELSYFDQFIRPQSTEPLTDFCKTLTGISDHDLVDAANFIEVFSEFLEWIGGIKKTTYFSWSPSDLFRLKMDALRHEIPERTLKKIEQRYTDFQKVFTDRVTKNPVSVVDALNLYDLEFIGDMHNPMYDAFNTFRVFQTYMNEPLQSDLIMVQKMIIEDTMPVNIKNVNDKIQNQLHHDVKTINEQLRHTYRLRDIKKLLKPIRRTVLKYENVILNRSGIFSESNIHHAQCFLAFYQDLVHTCEEHIAYSSKTVILHEHLLRPIEQITLYGITKITAS
ncbi:3'-5' exonuclease [Bacillus sp. J37]|uniref:3'-5' exonuclease n=1 Tax=Bacillus sp. J37 TaxID=935837 RepID=UPI00047A7A81|nr:3'-5' exonuclease [Bacillus sp. J37]